MKYKTHKIDVTRSNMRQEIDNYINKLEGEIISIVPHTTTFFLFYGTRTSYVVIVEKIK